MRYDLGKGLSQVRDYASGRWMPTHLALVLPDIISRHIMNIPECFHQVWRVDVVPLQHDPGRIDPLGLIQKI